MSAPIKAVVSDLDGVVYRGEIPMPGAVEAIAAWKTRGVPYLFVTNNASKSSEQFAAKLNGMGVDIGPEGVLTAGDAAASHIGHQFGRGTRTFVIGEKVLFEAAEREGLTVADAADVEVVLLGFDYGLNYAKLTVAVQALLNGAKLVVTNPDVLTLTSDGYEPCVGATLALLKASVPEVEPVVAGKPSPVMIREALARLGSSPEHTIMVGDQVVTDIMAGQSAGLRSFLLTTGVPARPVDGITPDAMIQTLLDIEVSGPAG
ncbi:MAG: phosphotransferase [Rhizobiales bacterium]|nr:phosphotransferase [Hyphomicrobiales bacterium]MBA69559.1 phosphotransferase [Hyphomicrobiales bacterium]